MQARETFKKMKVLFMPNGVHHNPEHTETNDIDKELRELRSATSGKLQEVITCLVYFTSLNHIKCSINHTKCSLNHTECSIGDPGRAESAAPAGGQRPLVRRGQELPRGVRRRPGVTPPNPLIFNRIHEKKPPFLLEKDGNQSSSVSQNKYLPHLLFNLCEALYRQYI
jgi:hypothetical protein